MAEKTNVITSNDIILFEPSDRSMFIDYPEFKEYEAFTKITTRDLKFVWYVSNRTSPIIREPKEKRIKKACELAYDRKVLSTNERIKSMYTEFKIPSDIVDAISVMASFNPDFRMRAKMLNEYNFDKLQSLVYLDEKIMQSLDLDDRKKYAELLIKTSAALGDMIVNLESGFGVKVKKEKQEEWSLKANVEGIIDIVEPKVKR